jgi:ribosome-associated heat shock protein Hsp15
LLPLLLLLLYRPGYQYEVKTEAKNWLIKVVDLLHSRVAYSEAIKYYIDLTPEEEVDKMKFQSPSFHTGKRQSKIGRPTKKHRRELGDFMEDSPLSPSGGT